MSTETIIKHEDVDYEVDSWKTPVNVSIFIIGFKVLNSSDFKFNLTRIRL